MPLTFPAHPLLVVPLKKYLPFPLSGLALFVGAMSPDFSYIFKLPRDIFHGGWEAFVYGVPLALLFYWWIERVMIPVVSSLIHSLAWVDIQALTAYRENRTFLWVLASLTLGIATHIFLDSATHDDWWPGKLYIVPGSVALLGGKLILSYEAALWWGTSLVFSLAMWAYAINTWPHRKPLVIARWGMALLGIFLAYWVGVLWYQIGEQDRSAAIHGVTARTFSIAVIGGVSLLWFVMGKKRHPQESHWH